MKQADIAGQNPTKPKASSAPLPKGWQGQFCKVHQAKHLRRPHFSLARLVPRTALCGVAPRPVSTLLANGCSKNHQSALLLAFNRINQLLVVTQKMPARPQLF